MKRFVLFTRSSFPAYQHGKLFLSPATWHATLACAVASFAARVESALTAAAATASAVPLAAFGDDLRLLAGVLAGRVDVRALMPAVWVFGYLVPYAVSAEEQEGEEGRRWLGWRGIYENTLDVLAEGTLGAVDMIAEVFPARAELDAMLDALPADPAAASLAVLHPHLPPASAIRKLKHNDLVPTHVIFAESPPLTHFTRRCCCCRLRELEKTPHFEEESGYPT
ncbi:hypothetical protein B0H16DRAFT_1748174 [Mycena metata]|uniref:Uncharacterized protein n=1 Tax=Mycena metata TaxID=1033252 RepID=A0AAD7DZQ1_9AGAR|nr:hypothetical protein B0H16DRAFT_1748174 [Mycena metata]